MDNLEEILKVVGGLIFGAIYLFGNQIFKSREKDVSQSPKSPRQSGNDDGDAAARERQIQEQIRRKIMERRQVSSSKSANQEPVAMHQEPRKEFVEVQKEVYQNVPHVESATTPEVLDMDDDFSWDTSDNVYEEQIQARLEVIEATKRRAEALKRQAGTLATVSNQSTHKPKFPADLLSGSVRSVLRSPRAARAAFIYGLALEKPISLCSNLK